MVVFEAEVEQARLLAYWWMKAIPVQSTSAAGSSIQAAMVFSAAAGSL
jgi:hypothetical protein